MSLPPKPFPRGPGFVVQSEIISPSLIKQAGASWVTATIGPDRTLEEMDKVIANYSGFGPMPLVTKSIAETEAAHARWEAKVMLAPFNEPDQASQANMSPDALVACYQKLHALGIPFGGPSICNIVQSADYWARFQDLGGCKLVNWIFLHAYGLSPAETVTRGQEIARAWGKAVLWTEGGTGGQATVDYAASVIRAKASIAIFQAPNDRGTGYFDLVGGVYQANALGKQVMAIASPALN